VSSRSVRADLPPSSPLSGLQVKVFHALLFATLFCLFFSRTKLLPGRFSLSSCDHRSHTVVVVVSFLGFSNPPLPPSSSIACGIVHVPSPPLILASTTRRSFPNHVPSCPCPPSGHGLLLMLFLPHLGQVFKTFFFTGPTFSLVMFRTSPALFITPLSSPL